MITKVKKSISISTVLLNELLSVNGNGNVSEFIEAALVYYIKELKKQERIQRDIEIINSNAKRFSKEAEENLKFQAMK
jgi:metal-responsive CopG/Arc/MetJ family transcriptional regulator